MVSAADVSAAGVDPTAEELDAEEVDLALGEAFSILASCRDDVASSLEESSTTLSDEIGRAHV